MHATLFQDMTMSLYFPSRVSLQELITCMLQVEVEQRYTALQVLDHPWVNVSHVLTFFQNFLPSISF